MHREIVYKELDCWLFFCVLVYWPFKCAYGRANEARRVFPNIHHHISMQFEIRSNENLIVSQFMQSNPNWMTWNIMQQAHNPSTATHCGPKFVIVKRGWRYSYSIIHNTGFQQSPNRIALGKYMPMQAKQKHRPTPTNNNKTRFAATTFSKIKFWMASTICDVNDIQLYTFLCELLSLFDWFIKCKQLWIDGGKRGRTKK